MSIEICIAGAKGCGVILAMPCDINRVIIGDLFRAYAGFAF